ncbi:hypothetical protein PIB30_063727 [Stylosanthes scabra]|uniref:Transmembrane protein n=1 Tax=Stylosanthes scabra TaxID=79078 RepID=A0ABU6WN38_9FABA|nr:hypothetical protein [Stylosanthes scabra]
MPFRHRRRRSKASLWPSYCIPPPSKSPSSPSSNCHRSCTRGRRRDSVVVTTVCGAVSIACGVSFFHRLSVVFCGSPSSIFHHRLSPPLPLCLVPRSVSIFFFFN